MTVAFASFSRSWSLVLISVWGWKIAAFLCVSGARDGFLMQMSRHQIDLLIDVLMR
jgi:hypothetical protein